MRKPRKTVMAGPSLLPADGETDLDHLLNVPLQLLVHLVARGPEVLPRRMTTIEIGTETLEGDVVEMIVWAWAGRTTIGYVTDHILYQQYFVVTLIVNQFCFL